MKTKTLDRPKGTMADKLKQTEQAMTNDFQPTPALLSKLAKMKRRSRPQLVKPDAIPIGGVIAGKILAFLPSFKKTIKGELLHLVDDTGKEFYFPVTAQIAGAFGATDGKNVSAEVKKEETGKQFVARRLADQMSAKWKKNMYVFEVFTD